MVHAFTPSTSSIIVLLLGSTTTSVVQACGGCSPAVYTASIAELNGSGVSGSVVVFAGSGVTGDAGNADEVDTYIGYGGFVEGLEPDLDASNCTAVNGCGVHVHDGTSCETTALQGGHLFAAPVTSDPWTEDRYSSDPTGYSVFGGTVDIGAVGASLAGKPFLVHAEDGSRVGCGLLEEIASYTDGTLLAADTEALSGSGVTGAVTVYPMGGGKVCYFGYSPNLEPDLLSFLEDGGTNCTATNGCGTHIHAGTDCTDSTTQLGHFYDSEKLSEDPWLISGYTSTDSSGTAYFADCVNPNETDYSGRAFLLHANDGSRVSCGILATAPGDVTCAGFFGFLVCILVSIWNFFFGWLGLGL